MLERQRLDRVARVWKGISGNEPWDQKPREREGGRESIKQVYRQCGRGLEASVTMAGFQTGSAELE